MPQFHLRTLLIVVAACCLLATGARYLPPFELRSLRPFAALLAFYFVVAAIWSWAYVRAPAATTTLTAVAVCGVFLLSFALCFVVQSRERTRNAHELDKWRGFVLRKMEWDDLHRPRSPDEWREASEFEAFERIEAKAPAR